MPVTRCIPSEGIERSMTLDDIPAIQAQSSSPPPTPSLHMQLYHTIINNSLFISVCILRDLPQQKNSRELCQGSSHNFICSHVLMKIFLFYETGKKQGNKKRALYLT
jgi:hypothetical protein